MLKNIAIFFTATFVIVLLFGLTLPSNYEITRTIAIKAPTEEVHSYLNDLEQWPKWAPWHNAENVATIKIGDISKGAGATQSWSGAGGTGSLEITAASSQSGVKYLLSFGQDDQDTQGNFTYQSTGDQTTVSWTMAGEMTMPVIGPYAVMIIDMMAGPTLVSGLDKLKVIVEGLPAEKVASE